MNGSQKFSLIGALVAIIMIGYSVLHLTREHQETRERVRVLEERLEKGASK